MRFDEAAIAAVLADEERGRRHFPGYRVREQQIQLARASYDASTDGGRLLLEGGTGVGKSLAYLAALIPFAIERAAGGIREPLLISTRTKLLQDQLLSKDIPAAAAMLGHPELRALSIKGRANYACAWRLEQVLAEGREPSIFPEDRAAYAALQACARTRPHGEIAGVAGGDARAHSRAARSAAAFGRGARGAVHPRAVRAPSAAVPSAGAARRSRARSSWSRITICCCAGRRTIPSFTHVVIDEAHELAGVADEVFAVEVRPEEILERFDELFGRPPASGRSGLASGLVRARSLERDARGWRRALHQDLSALGRVLAAGASEFGERELPADADRALPEAAALAETSARAARSDRRARSRRRTSRWTQTARRRSRTCARRTARRRGGAALRRSARRRAVAECVAGFERLELPYDRWRLAMPRGLAGAPRSTERFAARLETLDLRLGEPLRRRRRLRRARRARAQEHSAVPVERDARREPVPLRDAHARGGARAPRAISSRRRSRCSSELARRLGGRTLGLFTSLRRMHQAAELLAQRLRGEGFDVLTPRRASDDPAALVERFARAGGGSVLLGARTFWQGLDIPGPALQAVVIEKLPFEVPTELRKRRAARLARGRSERLRALHARQDAAAPEADGRVA